MPQPVDPRTLALVVAGGAAGVAARAVLLAPVTDAHAVPWATLGVNVAGSLLLGVVVGWLADRHPRLRALLGTGMLGGFTTYSAFAVETVLWLREPWLAAALVAASVLAGVTAAAAGLWIGRRLADVPGEVEPLEDAA
ncbi:fluoride efflux transporter FluC [Microbacterium aureliae]